MKNNSVKSGHSVAIRKNPVTDGQSLSTYDADI